jgi:hypothetical protein
MKRSLPGVVLVLVVLLGVPGGAWAQEFRNMELNAFISGTASTKSNYQVSFPQAIVPIQEQFHLNDALGGGFRFNINTTRHWGEEAFFSVQPNKAHFIRKTAPTAEQAFDTRVYNFGVNVMYYLKEEEGAHTRPFVSLGLGGTAWAPSGEAKQVANNPLQGNLPGFDTAAEFAFNYGVGLKHHLSDAFDLRGDLRGYITRNPTFNLPRKSSDPNAVVFPAFGALQTVELSVGVLYKFKR